MKPTHLTLLVIAALLFAAGATAFTYSTIIIKEVSRFPMDITVDYRTGLNGDPGIHFGVLPPQATSTKKIKVNNTYPHSITAALKLQGTLGSWINTDPQQVTLQPGEEYTFTLSATPPTGTPLGTYTGEAQIILKRIFN